MKEGATFNLWESKHTVRVIKRYLQLQKEQGLIPHSNNDRVRLGLHEETEDIEAT